MTYEKEKKTAEKHFQSSKEKETAEKISRITLTACHGLTEEKLTSDTLPEQ